jgi:chloramphenicol O-acetyltransferase
MGLVEWLKVKALSSSPSTEKNQNKPGFQYGKKEGE